MLLCKIKFEFVFGILEHQDGAVLEDDNYVVMFYLRTQTIPLMRIMMMMMFSRMNMREWRMINIEL